MATCKHCGKEMTAVWWESVNAGKAGNRSYRCPDWECPMYPFSIEVSKYERLTVEAIAIHVEYTLARKEFYHLGKRTPRLIASQETMQRYLAAQKEAHS